MPADSDLDEFLRRHGAGGGFKHVVVARGNRIVGVVRINTGIRRGIEAAYSGVTMDTVAQRNFTLARENDSSLTSSNVCRAATPPWPSS
jgi:chloride channel protein, CIC family